MYLIHYFNLNSKKDYFRLVKYVMYDTELGSINNNNHMILEIYHIDLKNSEILTFEEYKKRIGIRCIIPIRKRLINKLINFLEKYN